MEKTEQIIKSCRVQVDGRTYCMWKIPYSEDLEVRNSALAILIRNITPETSVNVIESAKDIIHSCEKFGYPCDRINTEGCNIFKNYNRRLKPQNKTLPHIPGSLQSIE